MFMVNLTKLTLFNPANFRRRINLEMIVLAMEPYYRIDIIVVRPCATPRIHQTFITVDVNTSITMTSMMCKEGGWSKRYLRTKKLVYEERAGKPCVLWN